MVKEITKFVTDDGKEFDTKTEALQHEHDDYTAHAKRYRQYTEEVSYEGRELTKKYPLSKESIWLVRGEDPNCDLGGMHHKPTLGYFSGTLDQVIHKAVDLPNFWQWGSGGSITEAMPPTITEL